MKAWMRAASLVALGLSLTACGRGTPQMASVLAPRTVQAKSLAGVTAAVKATLSSEFREQDRDQNVQLSLMEFKGSKFHLFVLPKVANAKLMTLTEVFTFLDVDGNASVSLAEFVAPVVAEKVVAEMRAGAASLFKQSDRNHDDHITKGELLPGGDQVAELGMVDRDGDLKIDLSEFEDAFFAGLVPSLVGPKPAPVEPPASTKAR